MAVVKFKERKIKKQQKIASISPELKANYQVMIDVFADLDSQTILNSINKPDGTPEMAHMIKSMRSLAKRKERIEAVAAKYPFFNELCNRLIIIKTPSTLKWDGVEMPYKNICRMIEKTYNLQLREGAKILFAAIENANIQRLKSNK